MSTPALALDALEETLAPTTGLGRLIRARGRLALMIVLSLLGHAATFYVFQVAYTPAGSLLPPPARVVLVPLDRPENASFARWLSLADATLATLPDDPATTGAALPDSLDLRYTPSYEAMPPAFKPLDPGVSSESIAAPPQPFVPGPVAMTNTPAVNAPAPPLTAAGPVAGPTRVVLSANLRERISLPLPPVRFAAGTASRPTEPSVFLLGVESGGGEPFLFPLRQTPANSGASNTDEADETAHAYLARLTFHPTDPQGDVILWGKATFYWGNDPSPPTP